jgi:RNA polymerase sigma-70 factor, ECF subfamily
MLAMRAGAAPSFEGLYQQWFRQVSRWVLALGARPADYEDVVQEVFTVAYRRLAHFDGSNVAGWLYQIARRKVRDYRRLSWVQCVLTPEASQLIDLAPDSARGPLDALETKQRSEILSRRLEKLPPEQRAVFLLFELEGCSGHEIAERQQVPLNTVWIRLYTARRKLRVRSELPRGRRATAAAAARGAQQRREHQHPARAG